jgi:CheY-like chemotaxis protein
LVSNAADALGDASGVIAVTTSLRDVDRSYLAEAHLETDLEPGPYVVLSVSDTGTGMSLQTRAKIFDPFFSTKFAGRGLGLAASVGIVHAHRGAIKVESAVGRGSTFTVLFPARPALAPPSRVEIAPTTEAWRGSGTLLVVDDDESVRGITKRILTLHGFEVLVASDGIDAIDVFEKNAARIRAVVLDMTMPRMGGEEAFRALRRIAPEVRVLLMSGYDEQEATTRFKDQGIAGFLPKPFVAGELMARLRRVLGE